MCWQGFRVGGFRVLPATVLLQVAKWRGQVVEVGYPEDAIAREVRVAQVAQWQKSVNSFRFPHTFHRDFVFGPFVPEKFSNYDYDEPDDQR